MANQNRILTTHVGSLVRPEKLASFLRKIEDQQPYDESAYQQCLQESIEEVARQQAEAGVDIISDGEFSKTGNWAWYIHQRISGFSTRPATPEESRDPLVTMEYGRRDFAAFPEFYAEYFPNPRVQSPPRQHDHRMHRAHSLHWPGGQVQRDIANPQGRRRESKGGGRIPAGGSSRQRVPDV